MALSDNKLPLSIISKTDLTRIQRELAKLDDFFVASSARRPGESLQAPRVSHLLDTLAKDGKVNLLEAAQRKSFRTEIDNLIAKAPSLHLSFASEPSPKALEQILQWFRQNIHPQALLQIGIQPSIAAGCVLRTPNQIFDMSLRTNLEKEEPYLAKLIDGATNV